MLEGVNEAMARLEAAVSYFDGRTKSVTLENRRLPKLRSVR